MKFNNSSFQITLMLEGNTLKAKQFDKIITYRITSFISHDILMIRQQLAVLATIKEVRYYRHLAYSRLRHLSTPKLFDIAFSLSFITQEHIDMSHVSITITPGTI